MESTRRPKTATRTEVTALPTQLPALTSGQIAFRAGCLVRVFGLGEDQIEDLQQEATARVLDEMRGHDPNRASWVHFARVVLDSWYKATAKRLRLTRARRTCHLSRDPADPANLVVARHCDAERAEFVAEVARLVECLSPDMRQMSLLLAHYPISQVAKKLGVDRGTVERRIQNHLMPVFENLRNKSPE